MDWQLILGFCGIIGAIWGFTLHEEGRITTLEVQQKNELLGYNQIMSEANARTAEANTRLADLTKRIDDLIENAEADYRGR